ncbi:Disease resistance protein RPP13 [Abeliophyllum distichum]|uniref:Disease resistance protein RPP13 n=1 Tax=Abeliophyllum distichum TaxID=126358 RepID=A0ABD1V1X6_9LAMI
MEDEELAECLYKILKGTRYLIVIDNMWDRHTLEDLKRYFPDDGTGNRILITTRYENMAKHSSKENIFKLRPLSVDECWDLLEQKVFKKERCPPELKVIGERISLGCMGIPLFVVMISGVHSNMKKKKESLWQWEQVTTSLTSCNSDDFDFPMDILKLGYKNLPNHLKQCYLYFHAFKEDTEIPVQKLLALWMAEGYIQKNDQKSLEDVAEEYLIELIHRNLLQVAKRRSDNGIKACTVHGLILDTCWKIAQKENFHPVVKKCPVRFDENCDSAQINNLETLSFVHIFDSKDEEMLRCSTNLRRLKCQISMPCTDLSFLNQLQSLKLCYLGDSKVISFPMNVKKLTLTMDCPWEMMSLIGTLPNLEILKLESVSFEGENWITKENEFQKLKFLKLDSLQLVQWNASRDHFPRLERLVLRYCYNLEKIPSELGCIPTLRMIEAHYCGINVKNSAMQIEEEQLKNRNEELKVIIFGKSNLC